MRRWPWITIVVAAVLASSPLGRDVIHAAFFSGEQLSRNIWQPLFFAAMLVFVVLGALEWWIRRRRRKRRAGRGGA